MTFKDNVYFSIQPILKSSVLITAIRPKSDSNRAIWEFRANFEIRFKDTNGEGDEERASRRRSISMDDVNDQSNKLLDSMTTIKTTTTTTKSSIIVKKTNISLAKSILSYLNGQN